MPDNALPTAQDDAASKKMLDETIQNLGVEVLILPTVNFVDPVRGTSPLRDGPRILRKIAKWDTAINAKADALTALFVGARAGLLLNFFLFPLARWLQFSPLPPCVRTLHIAPQFCLAGLPLSQLGSLDEVIHKAFIEVMRRVFAASAPCHGISARPDAAGVGTVDPPLAPIIELPDELAPADGKAQALAAPVEHARAPWHPGTLAPWHPGPGTLALAVFEDSGEGWGARCAVFRGERTRYTQQHMHMHMHMHMPPHWHWAGAAAPMLLPRPEGRTPPRAAHRQGGPTQCGGALLHLHRVAAWAHRVAAKEGLPTCVLRSREV